jgi:hypothetical protein
MIHPQPTAKKDGSPRYASQTCAHSTWLAGSVRDGAIETNRVNSSTLCHESEARIEPIIDRVNPSAIDHNNGRLL